MELSIFRAVHKHTMIDRANLFLEKVLSLFLSPVTDELGRLILWPLWFVRQISRPVISSLSVLYAVKTISLSLLTRLWKHPHFLLHNDRLNEQVFFPRLWMMVPGRDLNARSIEFPTEEMDTYRQLETKQKRVKWPKGFFIDFVLASYTNDCLQLVREKFLIRPRRIVWRIAYCYVIFYFLPRVGCLFCFFVIISDLCSSF